MFILLHDRARHEDCVFVHLIWDYSMDGKIFRVRYLPVIEVHTNWK